MADSAEVQINRLVKDINQKTERAMTAQEEQQLQAHIAKMNQTQGQASPADRAELQRMRDACCDLAKRREIVTSLNAGRLGTHWRFSVINGRVACSARPVPVPGDMEVLLV